jgi:D-sedoheptulose 7-phosphate isomerase
MAATDAEGVASTIIRDCIAAQQRLLERSSLRAIVDAALLITRSLSNGRKLLLFGNGGSASDAAHIAAEFVGRFQRDRRALPALSLSANEAAVTAIANDFGFEHVFVRQLEALGSEGDVAIAISTSGRSANVLAAVQAAAGLGIATIGLTGADGGDLGGAVDVCLRAAGTSTARIQESHILVAHVLCELVERQLD